MPEIRFLQLATEASYLLLAVGAVLAAVRWPERARIDIALLFGALGVSVILQEIPRLIVAEIPGAQPLVTVLILALPYLLLRLVDNFYDVARGLRIGTLAIGGLLAVAVIVAPPPPPVLLVVVALVYLVAGVLYPAGAFVARARATAGITSRRMWCAALGCGLLALLFGLAVVTTTVPTATAAFALLSQVTSLASGLSFIAAFVPPPFLRRAWRLPDLFAYLRASRNHLNPGRVSTDRTASREMLEIAAVDRALAAVARTVGARRALLWLADATPGGLALWSTPSTRIPLSCGLIADTFQAGRPRFLRELPPTALPDVVWGLFANGVQPRSAMAAPILVHGDKAGVLVVLADKGPIFVTDDLDIVTFFAAEIQLILESRQLRETTQELETLREADRLKDEFMAVVSHELRTPLTAISGYADILLRQMSGQLNDRQERHVSGIRDAARRLLLLINDLLDVSKLEAGTLDLHIAPVDPDAAVLRALTAARVLAATKGVTIQAMPADDGTSTPAVLADEDRLQQILLNLLANAIKFTPQGGTVSIGARAEEQAGNDRVVFEVVDTGIGIVPSQIERVWDRFYQGESSSTRRFGGTGLGLSIVKRLAELHGGSVAVSSPGAERGSTFQVRLPMAPEPVDGTQLPALPLPGAERVAKARSLAPRWQGDRPLVLVVEDDADIAMVLETYLEQAGFAVAWVADGYEALRQAHTLRPFAITLDVMLPKLDGWSVLNALKHDAAVADIPVVVISIVDNRSFGMLLGATDYLVKPIDPDQLRGVLQRLVGPPSVGQNHVLVVDDDPQIRDVLSISLAAAGWQVATAAGGREALAAIGEQRPSAVLLDLTMAEMDGFAVLQAIRQNPATRTVPVIVVTAKELTEEDQRRLSGAAQRVIQKQSVPLETLHEQVREVLAAHWAASGQEHPADGAGRPRN